MCIPVSGAPLSRLPPVARRTGRSARTGGSPLGPPTVRSAPGRAVRRGAARPRRHALYVLFTHSVIRCCAAAPAGRRSALDGPSLPAGRVSCHVSTAANRCTLSRRRLADGMSQTGTRAVWQDQMEVGTGVQTQTRMCIRWKLGLGFRLRHGCVLGGSWDWGSD